MCFLIVSEVGVWQHGAAEVAMAGAAVIFASAVAYVSARPLLVEKP
nr:hypothetical protein [Rhizobium sp. ACO-34A]